MGNGECMEFGPPRELLPLTLTLSSFNKIRNSLLLREEAKNPFASNSTVFFLFSTMMVFACPRTYFQSLGKKTNKYAKTPTFVANSNTKVV